MEQDDNQKSDNKRRQSLSIDKAAFLLLRIKRVFKKRSQSQQIEKRDKEGPRGQQPPPLLRSSTLPAIIVPGLNILHAQIGPNSTPNGNFGAKKSVKSSTNVFRSPCIKFSPVASPSKCGRSNKQQNHNVANRRRSSDEKDTRTVYLNEEDEEDEKEENDEEKLNVNDILEWFPRSVSSDSIVESTYCVDLVRRLPSPLSIKVKGRFCPGKCVVLYYILSFFFSRLVPPHCTRSSHHGPFDQLIIIFIPIASA